MKIEIDNYILFSADQSKEKVNVKKSVIRQKGARRGGTPTGEEYEGENCIAYSATIKQGLLILGGYIEADKKETMEWEKYILDWNAILDRVELIADKLLKVNQNESKNL
jgi:hypothetical protein